MQRSIASVALICAASVLPGCASIVSGHNQSLSVNARSEVGELSGAKCTLHNDKGMWYVTTPGSVAWPSSSYALTSLESPYGREERNYEDFGPTTESILSKRLPGRPLFYDGGRWVCLRRHTPCKSRINST